MKIINLQPNNGLPAFTSHKVDAWVTSDPSVLVPFAALLMRHKRVKSAGYKFLTFLVTAGNVAYLLWILVYGLDKVFSGSRTQITACIALLALLTLNAVILFRKRNAS